MWQICLKVILQEKVKIGYIKIGIGRRGSKDVNSTELAQVEIWCGLMIAGSDPPHLEMHIIIWTFYWNNKWIIGHVKTDHESV